MSGKSLYIRVRGKVQGPFNLEELRSMRDRGVFRRFHEVSADRRAWTPASALADLFGDPVAKVVGEEAATPASGGDTAGGGAPAAPTAGAAAKDEWFYQDDDGGEPGPVTKTQLVNLWRDGIVNDETYVLRGGTTSWQALNSLPELAPLLVRGKQRGPAKPLNKLALVALILGILWLGGVGSLLGVILGYIALRQVEQSKGRQGGRRMALAGLYVGAAMLVLVTPLAGFLFYKFYWATSYVQRLGQSATAEEITTAFKHRVYLVQTHDKTGSGILVASKRGRGLVVTNRHVIMPAAADRRGNFLPAELLSQQVTIKLPDQINPKTCRVAAYHHRLDLALLIADNESEKPASIAIMRQIGLHQGEAAVALGSPLGLEYFTSPGVISSTRGELGMLWTTCSINKGNSGGPLVLSRRGLLAGITTIDLKPLGAQSLGGCIPAEEIVDSLQRRLPDVWEWTHEYKDIAQELADLIPLEN